MGRWVVGGSNLLYPAKVSTRPESYINQLLALRWPSHVVTWRYELPPTRLKTATCCSQSRNPASLTILMRLDEKVAGAREDPSQTIQLREATMNKLPANNSSRIFTSQPLGNK